MTRQPIAIQAMTLLWALTLAPAATGDDASELARTVAEAHGVALPSDAPSSIRADGDIQVFGGFPGRFELRSRDGVQFRLDWDIGYARDVLVVNGDSAWQSGATPRELSGAEMERLHRIPLVLRLPALLSGAGRFELDPGAKDEAGNLMLRLIDERGGTLTLHVDADTYLIAAETREDPFEEGPTEVKIEYHDYRPVDGVELPFLWRWSRPDMPMRLVIDTYATDVQIGDEDFAYPHADTMQGAPYELSISTLPRNVYKEDDGQILIGGWYRGWGTPYAPTESWLFHAVIDERYGRWVEPVRAVLELFAGEDIVGTVELGHAVLEGRRSYPAARFNALPEIYNFRHALHEVKSAATDRIRYTFEGRTPGGQMVSAQTDIPIRRYEQRNRYIFPLKGKFLIPNAHDYDMLFHTYERSQHFSYDILALGDHFELAANGGASSVDFYSFRRTEIIAPADGFVVYARNDVPDTATSEEYLRTVPDPKQAIGGNLMVIDHGGGEFSLLAHMAQGTVRVETGDRVVQGQVLGLLGSAGSGDGLPHLHYQLQAGPGTFEDDPLPVVFDNVSYAGFFKGDGATVLSPGVPYEAK